MQPEVSTLERREVKKQSIPTLKNYINGKWVESSSGKRVPNINPANTEDVLCYT
ncbi:MAG: hypothetical protein HY707_00890, partial [Ignavibacteriae bacterium]|nr:hypothetical protein [Ignavibacteriota bacterium]